MAPSVFLIQISRAGYGPCWTDVVPARVCVQQTFTPVVCALNNFANMENIRLCLSPAFKVSWGCLHLSFGLTRHENARRRRESGLWSWIHLALEASGISLIKTSGEPYAQVRNSRWPLFKVKVLRHCNGMKSSMNVCCIACLISLVYLAVHLKAVLITAQLFIFIVEESILHVLSLGDAFEKILWILHSPASPEMQIWIKNRNVLSKNCIYNKIVWVWHSEYQFLFDILV